MIASAGICGGSTSPAPAPSAAPGHADALLDLANGRHDARRAVDLRLTPLEAEVLGVWTLPAIPIERELTTTEVGTALGFCPDWSRRCLHHRLVALARRGILEIGDGTRKGHWKPGAMYEAARGVRGGGAA